MTIGVWDQGTNFSVQFNFYSIWTSLVHVSQVHTTYTRATTQITVILNTNTKQYQKMEKQRIKSLAEHQP